MEFLAKEVHYNTQLLSSLKAIQGANDLLRKLEVQAAEHNLVDALHTLAGMSTCSIYLFFVSRDIPVPTIRKALLDLRF